MKRLFIFFVLAVCSLGMVLPTMAQQGGGVVPAPADFNVAEANQFAGSLNGYRTVTIQGDYVAVGLGLRGANAGLINLTDIPVGATVSEAYIYWSVLANVADGETVIFDGQSTTGTLIGQGEDTCWQRAGSFSYRANVTSAVAANGSYSFVQTRSNNLTLSQGVTLVVLYEDLAGVNRDVVIYNGQTVINEVAEFTETTLLLPATATNTNAKTTFIVGDGQVFPEQTFINGVDYGTDVFEGGEGPLWDTDTLDISGILPADPSSFTVRIEVITDCLSHIAQIFSSDSVSADNEAPVWTVPADFAVEATSPSGAIVNYVATVTDNIGVTSAACTPASGSQFLIGLSIVSCSASDAAGNVGNATFNVTVQDTTPPVLTVPADILQSSNGPFGTAVNFTVTATDIVGVTSLVCDRASGDLFDVGTTTVTCQATDGAGNFAVDSFDVEIFVDGGSVGDLDDSIGDLDLPNGVEKNLTGVLKQIEQLLNDANPNNDGAACNKLDSFIGKVADELADGNLTPEQAAALTAYAESIQAAFGC